jgi:hypothetical protein
VAGRSFGTAPDRRVSIEVCDDARLTVRTRRYSSIHMGSPKEVGFVRPNVRKVPKANVRASIACYNRGGRCSICSDAMSSLLLSS